MVLVDYNDNLWFGAKQTAKSLGYLDPRNTIRNQVNRKDIVQLKYINHNINNYSGHPQTLFLSETGLYTLIFKSRMKRAKAFAEWILSEILPSVRKYDTYRLKTIYDKEKSDLLKKIVLLEKKYDNNINDI